MFSIFLSSRICGTSPESNFTAGGKATNPHNEKFYSLISHGLMRWLHPCPLYVSFHNHPFYRQGRTLWRLAWYVSRSQHMTKYTAQKSFRSVTAPCVIAVIPLIFSEALPVIPRLIIHIGLLYNSLRCNNLLKYLCFSISLPIRSKYTSENKSCACYKVCHAER